MNEHEARAQGQNTLNMHSPRAAHRSMPLLTEVGQTNACLPGLSDVRTQML